MSFFLNINQDFIAQLNDFPKKPCGKLNKIITKILLEQVHNNILIVYDVLDMTSFFAIWRFLSFCHIFFVLQICLFVLFYFYIFQRYNKHLI